MKHTKKILALLLSLCMLAAFLPVAVHAAPSTVISVASYEDLAIAIETANAAQEQTVIRLTQDISVTELSKATLPTVTGDVVLDLNDCALSFQLYYTLTAADGPVGAIAVPADMTAPTGGADVIEKGILNIAAGGALQIVNTGTSEDAANVPEEWLDGIVPVSAAMGASIHISNSHNVDLDNYTATACLIHNAGTLVIGNAANTEDNDFLLLLSVYFDGHDAEMKQVFLNASAVTVDGEAAQFFMYGGIISQLPAGACTGIDCAVYRAYALNIEKAYTAEIYGGMVFSNTIDELSYNPAAGSVVETTSYLATIRANTPNVYIFDIFSFLNYTLDKGNAAQAPQLADIHTVGLLTAPWAAGSAFPNLFGGQFLMGLTLDKGSANISAYAVEGGYSYLDGGAIGETTANGILFQEGLTTATNENEGVSYQCCAYSALALADEATDNGLYHRDYANFREFVSTRTPETDACCNTAGKTVTETKQLSKLDGFFESADNVYTESEAFLAVLEDLNALCGTNYKSGALVQTGWTTTEKTTKGIQALLECPLQTAPMGYTVFCHPVFAENPQTAIDISEAEVTVEDQVYAGSAVEPAVTVTLNGTELQKDRDYTVEYQNNTAPGTATVIITGIGDYTGTATQTFAITADLSDATVDVEDQTYTGNAVEPAVTVTLNGTELQKDRDYTVTYQNNTEKGTARVTITGIGNYEGQAFGSFEIVGAPEEEDDDSFSILEWIKSFIKKLIELLKTIC